MATIRVWKISKEEQQAGSYMNCVKCGARIVNIVEIDGHAHGSDCAARILGWKDSVAKINKKIDEATRQIRIARRALIRYEQNGDEKDATTAVCAASEAWRLVPGDFETPADYWGNGEAHKARIILNMIAAGV